MYCTVVDKFTYFKRTSYCESLITLNIFLEYFWNNFIVLQANQTSEDTKLQVLKTTIKKLVISLWLCGLLMSPHVSGVHGYLSLIARKSAAT